MDTTNRIRRSRNDRVLAGICGGLAARYGWDAALVRILLVLAALLTAIVPLVLTYLFAWWLVPPAEGTEEGRAPATRLHRSASERMIGGVLGGLSETWNADPSILRVLAVLATLLTLVLPGVVAYVVAWIVIPLRRPEDHPSPEHLARA